MNNIFLFLDKGGKVIMAKLGTPQNVSLDGTVLSWDSVPGATAYNIYADNALYTTVINNVMPVIFK